MFDIGWSELFIIAVVVIAVFPPKDIPKLLRTTGQMVSRVRRVASDFQAEVTSALREAEKDAGLTETQEKIEDLRNFNPLAELREAFDPLRSAGEDIKRDMAAPLSPSPSASTVTAAESSSAAPSPSMLQSVEALRKPSPKPRAPRKPQAPQGEVS